MRRVPLWEIPVVARGFLSYRIQPLFRANHNWTMARGQEHIVEYLRKRSGKPIGDAP